MVNKYTYTYTYRAFGGSWDSPESHWTLESCKKTTDTKAELSQQD